ncbi:MAG: hypothetical protein DME77_03075 [Verrucomicrobia bacterium]|nr:MAG: hypothetical protein DME77_03075 [Verrucomicrobiota bacterium]
MARALTDAKAFSRPLLSVAELGVGRRQTVARPRLRAVLEKIPNPLKDEPELHAYVTNFYVVPEMRDKGLGKRLLNKALSWCRSRGTDAVILWASPASKSLYRRCGFVAPSDIFELKDGATRRRSRRQFKSENGQLR